MVQLSKNAALFYTLTGPVAQLITFTYVKEWLPANQQFVDNSWYILTLAALASHFVVATLTNPIESALNRLHHQVTLLFHHQTRNSIRYGLNRVKFFDKTRALKKYIIYFLVQILDIQGS